MAGVSEDRDRQVVPRLRTFQSTVRHGELSALKGLKAPSSSIGSLDELAHDWADRKGISTAADLVSAAFVSGREAVAAEAARYLLAQNGVPYGAKSIAAICLKKLGETTPDINVGTPLLESEDPAVIIDSSREKVLRIQIHAAREQLADYPQNPMLWSNLAIFYTSVGSQRKSTQAMRVALALAPTNRFILRVASRLMLHQGDGREAHRLLATAQSLQSDPWVLSAEIATAAALGRTSRHIKHARKFLEGGRFSPSHLSELASALGTLEATSGNRKSSRLLINQSLQQPSENAVAQAAWLSRNVGIVASTAIDLTRSAEAAAWQAFRAADWNLSLNKTEDWFTDQPYSSRPAIHGSFITSAILEKYDLAVEFAQFGLLSNPDDVCLYNNLAFAYAQRGDVDRAMKVMHRLDFRSISPGDLSYVIATMGLIEFRSGRPEQGRTLYNQALQFARKTKNERAELVQVYLAFEELRLGSPFAEKSRADAIAAASDLTETWCQTLIDRLRKYQPSRPSVSQPLQFSVNTENVLQKRIEHSLITAPGRLSAKGKFLK